MAIARRKRSARAAQGTLGCGRLSAIVAALVAAFAAPFPAAQASSADRCLAVASRQPLVQPASYRVASLKKSEVRLTFVGHATFLIESAGGIRIATDYNDYVKPAVLPDIATMNRAHNSHFTDVPDPGIKHVLRGWGTASGAAITHDLEVGDVRVRNVVTNIRDHGGGTQLFANSIFIFEIAGLCIAHLGHLHHTLTPKHLEQIGQIDIALVPVDGSYTLDLPGMIEVVKALRSRLIIPMHYFSTHGLNRFLDQAGAEFPVKHSSTPELIASKTMLPPQPEILVLPGH
jgi:L-ascorbate metabolism protein UlaG (beta-lactamase superfamily)